MSKNIESIPTLNEDWYLGIDLGTGSVKVMILDNDFNILQISSGKYAQESIMSEQDADMILDTMIKTVQEAIKNAQVNREKCAAMSMGCALHGVMAVDQQGKPLTGLYTWADGRAEKQARRIKEEGLLQEIYTRTGCPIHGMYWPYKIMWIRENHPEIYSKCSKFVSIKSYILERFLGDYVCDYPVAAGGGFLNVETLLWDEMILELAGIGSSHLPALVSPAKKYDHISASMAKALGVGQKSMMIIGGSDALNSSLGAGAFDAATATCMVGTSGALRIISEKPLIDPLSRSWCYAIDQEQYLVGGAINNGGIALMWLKQMTAGTKLEDYSEAELVSLAQEAEGEMGDLICLPYFAGERSPNWNLSAKATFFGLTMDHNIRHMSLAVLQGIGFRLYQLLEILGQIQDDIQQIRISGGITKSEYWMQLVCDILGTALQVPECGETSVLGSAMWAWKGAGRITDFTEFQDYIKVEKTYQPDRQKHADHMQNFIRFKELYAALQRFY
ncbi:MAG: gluconokinase [Anaerolineaceae bacterium]|nr:gluconokinase [Anaerolineaceae bacterium]